MAGESGAHRQDMPIANRSRGRGISGDSGRFASIAANSSLARRGSLPSLPGTHHETAAAKSEAFVGRGAACGGASCLADVGVGLPFGSVPFYLLPKPIDIVARLVRDGPIAA